MNEQRPEPDREEQPDQQPENEAETPQDSGAQEQGPSPALPPFDAARLRRQLSVDGAARWVMIIVVALAVVLASLLQSGVAIAAVVGVMALMFAIASGVTVSLRTLRDLAMITTLLGNPYQSVNAESLLAVAIRRWPLPQWLRVLLVHRWAVLRHQQGDYQEAAAIASALLHVMPRTRQQSVKSLASHTLLMRLEAQLQLEDLTGAYHTLLELDRQPLTQVERLQRLSLQTRYELMCGWPGQVAKGLERKVELAELMPAPQCGVMHAMLAQACATLGHRPAADWLSARADLLASAEQVEQLLATGGVVGPPPAHEITG